MRPPAWFTRALGILDPLLEVRRSTAAPRWVIARRAAIPFTEIDLLRKRDKRLREWIADPTKADVLAKNKKTWHSVHDELVSAEAGSRVICTPNVLNQEVYNDLCRADMQRYGGYARFCDAIEAEELKQDVAAERTSQNRRNAFNAEVYDIMSFLMRKRAVAEDHGEKDLKYLLHGQRTQPGEAPLIQLTDF